MMADSQVNKSPISGLLHLSLILLLLLDQCLKVLSRGLLTQLFNRSLTFLHDLHHLGIHLRSSQILEGFVDHTLLVLSMVPVLLIQLPPFHQPDGSLVVAGHLLLLRLFKQLSLLLVEILRTSVQLSLCCFQLDDSLISFIDLLILTFRRVLHLSVIVLVEARKQASHV